MDSCIEFSDYKIFENGNHKFMYCVDDNKLFEIDDKTLALLNENGKSYSEIEKDLAGVFSGDELKELVKSMKDFEIIKSDNKEIEKSDNGETDDVSAIVLLVAQDCNLRCRYCYADEGTYHNSGRMNSTTAKKAVDFLINKSKSDNLGICFFGGEPLLNFNLLKEVVAYCHKREKEVNKKFDFSMTTNGTLLNDEITEFIRENRISVQISIDGDRDTHNRNRYFKGKVGTFDTVFEKTKYLREKGVLGARGTIAGKDSNLVHTYDFLKSIGFKRVVLAPAFNLMSDEDYDKLADSYIELCSSFEKDIKKKKYDEARNNYMIMHKLSYIHTSRKRTKACGAGKNMYAIDINGDIYPCQRFVGEKRALLGNIFENDYKQKEFIPKTNVNNFSKCSKCWIRNLCVGGCVQTNLSLTNDMSSPYEPYCEFERKITAEYVKMYIRLSDEEINELFEEGKEVSCSI